MDTAMTRKGLEEMLDGLDRSSAVLKGESPAPGDRRDSSFDPADAGANLSETDRIEAVLHSAQRQRGKVEAALRRMSEGTYGCQTLVRELNQFGVVQAMAGEAARRQLLSECFCA